MNTYLTIITTVLVISQIVRCVQNQTMLRRIATKNDRAFTVLNRMDEYLDKQEGD